MIQCIEFHTLNFISYNIWSRKNLEIRNYNLEITNIRKMPLHYLKDIMQFLRDNPKIRDLVPKHIKFIRMLLTILISTYSNERSFSYLRYLKSYLQSTMKQKRKSYCDIIHLSRNDR